MLNAFIASAADTAAATTIRLRLRLDFDLSLHRVSDEALLVRGMIHLLNVLGRRLMSLRRILVAAEV